MEEPVSAAVWIEGVLENGALRQTNGSYFSAWLAAHDAEVRAIALRDAEDAAAAALNTWWRTDTGVDGDTDSVLDVRRAVRALRSGVVAEEPDWEYGTESRFEESDEVYEALEWRSREQAQDVARDYNAKEVVEDREVRLRYSVVKRVPAVPAGPWVPIDQDGA